MKRDLSDADVNDSARMALTKQDVSNVVDDKRDNLNDTAQETAAIIDFMNRNERNPSPMAAKEALRGEEEYEVTAGKEDLED